MELATFRYDGHSPADPQKYIDPECKKEIIKKRDPISTFKKKLIDSLLATEEELKEIESSVKAEVQKAADKALSDPQPLLSELYTHIYKDPVLDCEIRGCDPFTWIKAN